VKNLGCLIIIFGFFQFICAQSDIVAEVRRNAILNYAEAMYRNPTDKELKLVAVDPELLEKHRDFLTKDKTGIFRLIPDFGCNENRNIIVAKEECIKYSMPGSGSAYSFRKDNYRIWRLADLIYREGVFYSGSRYIQGIIGVLGDLDLDEISLKSIGVKQLSEFIPVGEFRAIEQQYKRIERGVIVNGVLFSNKLKIKENTTYVLRSIAYRGRSYTSVGVGAAYNEFEFDKRFDILVVFRVLKKERDDSVIILWKELERKVSPKIRFPPEKLEK
jgi:hypothetical protein